MQLALRLESTRLSHQCGAILERLRRGPVGNRELAERYSLKYTSRISDLRHRGHDVRVIWRDRGSGETLYALFVNGERAA